ncbi:MAG TPA: NAD(P)-binding domain-containing protein [Chloroflexia bacterium]|nr:NAD(P)-binding domain-containing protein [Chloroflexia bacterium]
MAKIYFSEDGDLSVLEGKTVSVLGYGNQGTAQSQNLRDSGVHVVIGNRRDASFEQAVADGFETYEVAEAVQHADYHLLLVPDEIMPHVFAADIAPHLKPSQAIVVSSGYNLTYGFLHYPTDIDVLMIAPRMIGTGVRNSYVAGNGFPSLVSVEQDASGNAQAVMLALAKGIGTLMGGAVSSNADEETLCDLFNEHFGYVYSLRRAYEELVTAGASPEAALLEFWASGEEMELARVHMTHGLFHQLKLHSQTSQYGQEVTSRLSAEDEEVERRRYRGLIERIKDGTFARDWALEQQAGHPVWNSVHKANMAHPMIAEEERLLRALKVLERDSE